MGPRIYFSTPGGGARVRFYFSRLYRRQPKSRRQRGVKRGVPPRGVPPRGVSPKRGEELRPLAKAPTLAAGQELSTTSGANWGREAKHTKK